MATVTIVGAGNMGRGIGTRAVAGGRRVEIVDHDQAKAQKLAGELGEHATALEPGASFGGEIVVFAVYYPGIKDAVQVAGQQLDVLIAGDDQAAKQQVSQLVSDGGLRPIDVGPLGRAQQLEQLGFLHISLQQPLDLGFGSAIKLVRP